jgi:tetratricopeptide (TPR) repeat protein
MGIPLIQQRMRPTIPLLLSLCLTGYMLCPTCLRGADVGDLILKASKYSESKSYQDALLCYERAVVLDPKSTVAHYGKGVMLGNLGRYGDAIHAFDRVLEIDPDFISALRGKATSLRAAQRFQEADESLRRANAIEGRWQNEALLAYENHDYEQASLRCSQLIYHRAAAGWAYNLLGMTRFAVKEYEQSLACFDRSIESDRSNGLKDDPAVVCNKADSLLQLKRYDEALVCCEAVLSSSGRYERAWRLKAQAAAALGRSQEACAALEKARFIQLEDRIVDGLSRWSGGMAIGTLILGIVCIFVGRSRRLKRFSAGGKITLGVASVAALIWAGLHWMWVAICAGSALVIVVLAWLSSDWWENLPARVQLRQGRADKRIDAALLLQGSTARADVKALVRALRDPEICGTAEAILKQLNPAVLQTLQRLCVTEKEHSVKTRLESIIGQIQANA